MAEYGTSASIVGTVAKPSYPFPVGIDPISRIEIAVGKDNFVVVGHGEAMAGKFSELRLGQSVKITGSLISHRWKTPGNIEHTAVHVKAETLEILS